MQENKCPICFGKNTDKLILDLIACKECGHIYKQICITGQSDISKIHKLVNPVEEIRTKINIHKGVYKFRFPSMMFFTEEIYPSNFYKNDINHYFNQISLMILLDKCNLKPRLQINVIEDGQCITEIECEVNE